MVRQSLAKRSPLSTRTGREGIAPDRVLRCCIMKHLKGWSFRDLTFSRTFALLSPAVTQQIHQRVVAVACEQGVAQGRKL